MSEPHCLPVQVYYEDTDHSGFVYHANYLKFFERAREHLLGVEELLRLARDQGLQFLVYEVKVKYHEGARFGDQLVVRTWARCCGPYRLRLRQEVTRPGSDRVMVGAWIDLVCVDRGYRLVRLPESVARRFPSEPLRVGRVRDRDGSGYPSPEAHGR